MSLAESPLSKPTQGDGPDAEGRLSEARSWLTGEAFESFVRSPSAYIGMPGGKHVRQEQQHSD